MVNIWSFLLQTLTVSLVAVLLLIVKRIFEDKLSPRWQYGVWSVLLLRLLVPADMSGGNILSVPLWVEFVKTKVEAVLNSAYSAVYEPVTVIHIFPIVKSKPMSVTDWLFVLYSVGIICCLLKYLLTYPRLRKILKHSKAPSEMLLHLKYANMLQNIGWCILRALHWCNPFLQYVFDRIGNDMEALCDQRVLERLEGEEPREYGVRFKKYPKGMTLVSVCIVLVMASSTVFGMTSFYDTEDFKPKSLAELEIAMAMTRVNRCSTVAGAIDTYVKGLIFDNGIFLAAASPLEKQEELYAGMQQSSEDGWVAYHLQTGYELEYLDTWTGGYYIVNLKELSENIYSAVLIFDVYQFPEIKDGAVVGLLRNEEGTVISGCVQIPIEIHKENGWVVDETGARENVFEDSMFALDEVPALKKLIAVGKTGNVTVEMSTRHHVDDQTENQSSFFAGNTISETPLLDAEFDSGFMRYETKYSIGGKTLSSEPENYVGAMFKCLDSLEEETEFPDERMWGDMSGSSSAGYEWSSQSVTEDWDGILKSGGGGSCEVEKDGSIRLPDFCKVQIYWDGDLMEELIAREVAP